MVSGWWLNECVSLRDFSNWKTTYTCDEMKKKQNEEFVHGKPSLGFGKHRVSYDTALW